MNLFKGSLIASLLCLSPLCYAQIDDIDAKTKAKIESIIDEYVSTHPEIIIRAMQKLEHDEQAVQANNVKNAGIALRNDSTLPQINTSRAKHYIVEFFDFNCGYCKVLEPMLEKALKEFDLQIIYVNIPIIKEESSQAAIFTQAVYNIDKNAYFKFHKYFMTPGYRSSDTDTLKKLCKEYNVDFDKVLAELKSKRPHERITKSIAQSSKLKISGTPYLIIDGKELRGAFRDYSQLKALLED